MNANIQFIKLNSQNSYAGDVAGAVPVGIETFENEDQPYMPMQVNATYKEIWTHTTAGVMWLVSRLIND
ncbi:hypothetical protein BH11BAC5_BH11BAC5_32980 [soil metagenome]